MVAGFSETDAAKIQLGQPAVVSFNSLPNQSVAGKVTEIDVNSTTVSNVITYNVTVSVTKPPTTLKPGMTANVSVTTAERDGVVELPSSAVNSTSSTATIQVVGPNGKPQPRTITIGLKGDTADEITTGLNPGDKIVVTNSGTSGGSLPSGFKLPAGIGGGLGGGLGGGG